MRFRGVLKERKPSSQTETELKRQDMTSNCVALVTGANKGLGQEVARQLGRRGMTVLRGCRDRTRGEAAAAGVFLAGPYPAPTAREVAQAASSDAGVVDTRRANGQVLIWTKHARMQVVPP